MYTCKHICILYYTHTNTLTDTHTHIYMCVCVCARACMRVFACVYINIREYIYIYRKWRKNMQK